MYKIRLSVVLVVLLALVGSSMAATSVLRWRCDDNSASATTLTDSFVVNPGTLSDVDGIPGATTAAHQTAGVLGGAMTFDGVDDVVSNVALTGIAMGPTDQWTINFWIKPDVEPVPLTNVLGVGLAVDPLWTPLTKMMASYRADGLHFWDQNHDLSMGFALDTGVWNMVTIIYDGTGAKKVQFYKNGVVGTDFPGIGLTLDPILSLAPSNVWDTLNRFEGAIDEVEIFSGLLTGSEILGIYENAPRIAHDPSPLDGDQSVDIITQLSWLAPTDTDLIVSSYDVYIGTTSIDPNDPNTFGTPVNRLVADYSPVLSEFTEFFWLVVTNGTDTNGGGSVPFSSTGEVWSFKTWSTVTKALLVSPADAAIDVDPADQLEWTAGNGADNHDLYFGTVLADVQTATTVSDPGFVYLGRQPGTTFDPDPYGTGDLDWDTTYYWRIDEVAAGVVVVVGDVWSFTTMPFACTSALMGDTNGDCKVDLDDFAWVAGDWLECTAPRLRYCDNIPDAN